MTKIISALLIAARRNSDVMLHARRNSMQWLHSRLSEKTRRVIALDMPGMANQRA
jgi:hypothetical protein